MDRGDDPGDEPSHDVSSLISRVGDGENLLNGAMHVFSAYTVFSCPASDTRRTASCRIVRHRVVCVMWAS
jgi:hypothetical protein